MPTVTSQCALAELSEMPQLPPGSSILGRRLAKKTATPANYQPKILLSLCNAGLVATALGSGGGHWLVCPPDYTGLVKVLELLDGSARPSCLLGVNERCNDDQPCSAHASWRNGRLAYQQFLESTTLADVAGERGARRTKARAARAGGRQS